MAAFDADHKLLSGLGESSGPVTALLPLPLFHCWCHLALTAAQLGAGRVTQLAANVVLPHFVESQPDCPVWEANPMDRINLNRLVSLCMVDAVCPWCKSWSTSSRTCCSSVWDIWLEIGPGTATLLSLPAIVKSESITTMPSSILDAYVLACPGVCRAHTVTASPALLRLVCQVVLVSCQQQAALLRKQPLPPALHQPAVPDQLARLKICKKLLLAMQAKFACCVISVSCLQRQCALSPASKLKQLQDL